MRFTLSGLFYVTTAVGIYLTAVALGAGTLLGDILCGMLQQALAVLGIVLIYRRRARTVVLAQVAPEPSANTRPMQNEESRTG